MPEIAGRDEKGKPLTAEQVEERTKKKLEADEKSHEEVREQVKKEADEATKAADAQEKSDKEFREKEEKGEKEAPKAAEHSGARPAHR